MSKKGKLWQRGVFMNNDQPIIKRLEEMLRFIEKFEIIYIYMEMNMIS